jgi:hypothetical protein
MSWPDSGPPDSPVAGSLTLRGSVIPGEIAQRLTTPPGSASSLGRPKLVIETLTPFRAGSR